MSKISMLSLVREIDTLLTHDYNHIPLHDPSVPKEVLDTKTDITYLLQSLSFLDNLFGDGTHTHTLQLPTKHQIKALNKIDIPLSEDLKELHAVLRTWPDPPSALGTATFSTMHNRAVHSLRKKIEAYQLRFVVFLSEVTTLPTPLIDGTELTAEEPVSSLESEVEIEHAENPESESLELDETWEKLNELLKHLPPALRLSHLIEKLEAVCHATTDTEIPQLGDFNWDVVRIAELSRILDRRLLAENHFATEVRQEIHTIVDLEIKLLLHELKVLPALSLQGKGNQQQQKYQDLPIHYFLRDHQVVFMMILAFVAGVRDTEEGTGDVGGGEGKEVDAGRGRGKGDLYEDAAAAVLERIAVHSGACNSWCEVKRSWLK